MNKTKFDLLVDLECAIAPIDDVINLLDHAHDSFYLGYTTLDEGQQYDLITHHGDLGSILRIAIHELHAAVDSFNDTHCQLFDSIKTEEKASEAH